MAISQNATVKKEQTAGVPGSGAKRVTAAREKNNGGAGVGSESE